MRIFGRSGGPSLWLALCLALAAPVLASAHSHDQDLAGRLQAAGEVLPLQEVLGLVARDYPGQVLRVEFEDDEDCVRDARPAACPSRWIYELRILQSEGRLVKLKVDARDGRILSVKRRARHSERADHS
ncbi:PepSY domain-containing protein [Castellaniella sp. GW247-6E4]|uniref:PepSY domain-containing protein n=1 Tax=Castellaniella sp. GW247-6E4 TaxID=3140380 RepID=UPI00331488B2